MNTFTRYKAKKLLSGDGWVVVVAESTRPGRIVSRHRSERGAQADAEIRGRLPVPYAETASESQFDSTIPPEWSPPFHGEHEKRVEERRLEQKVFNAYYLVFPPTDAWVDADTALHRLADYARQGYLAFSPGDGKITTIPGPDSVAHSFKGYPGRGRASEDAPGMTTHGPARFPAPSGEIVRSGPSSRETEAPTEFHHHWGDSESPLTWWGRLKRWLS